MAPRDGSVYRFANRCAEIAAVGLALVGGGVILVIIALTCISIIGRAFVPFEIGIGPILGIYDITEIGMAAAIFAFLPWAQLTDAHARVDLFRDRIPSMMAGLLEVLFNTAMLVAAGVGAWRLYLGMQDKFAYGETTLIAQIPVWYGYAAAMVGATGFVLVAAFCVIRSVLRLAGVEPAAGNSAAGNSAGGDVSGQGGTGDVQS